MEACPPTQIIAGDNLEFLQKTAAKFDLSFVDPPFNQGRFYRKVSDNLDADVYWQGLRLLLDALRRRTSVGGGVFFMHREKNAEDALRILREAGWTFQNLIVWKKMASAVPCQNRFGKHYQIIVYATCGAKPRVFHRLRIDPPLAAHHKAKRDAGMYATDVWDDIRELTSGYFAGNEPLRDPNGGRFHKQQSPNALLARIILSATNPGDTVFDPYAGTGTTLTVARQLGRASVGVELDPENVENAQARLQQWRAVDDLQKLRPYYRFTPNFNAVWPSQCPQKPASTQAPRRRVASVSSAAQKHARLRVSSV